MMRHTLCSIAAALLALLVVTACGSTREQSGEGQSGVRTVLDVRNRHWLSMEVYVVAQSQRVRLGRVRTGETETFAIPPHLLSGATPLQFVMEASGPSPVILSEEIVVVPGDAVILVIPNTR